MQRLPLNSTSNGLANVNTVLVEEMEIYSDVNYLKKAIADNDQETGKKILDFLTDKSRKINPVIAPLLFEAIDEGFSDLYIPYVEFYTYNKHAPASVIKSQRDKCEQWLKIIFYDDFDKKLLRTIAIGLPIFIGLKKCGFEAFAKMLASSKLQSTGGACIHYAARTSDIGLLKEMLDLNIDVNLSDSHNSTPLMHSVFATSESKSKPNKEEGKDQSAAFKLLCRHHAINVNVINNIKIADNALSRNSTLHYIVIYDNVFLLKLILTNKTINLNLKDSDGDTPLVSAAKLGFTTIAKILLEHGADIAPVIADLSSIKNTDMVKLINEFEKKLNSPAEKINNKSVAISLTEAITTKNSDAIIAYLFEGNKRKKFVNIHENILDLLYEKNQHHILEKIFSSTKVGENKLFIQELAEGNNISLFLRAIEISMLLKKPSNTSTPWLLATYFKTKEGSLLLRQKKIRAKLGFAIASLLFKNSSSTEPTFNQQPPNWELLKMLLQIDFEKHFFLKLANARFEDKSFEEFAQSANDDIQLLYKNIADVGGKRETAIVVATESKKEAEPTKSVPTPELKKEAEPIKASPTSKPIKQAELTKASPVSKPKKVAAQVKSTAALPTTQRVTSNQDNNRSNESKSASSTTITAPIQMDDVPTTSTVITTLNKPNAINTKKAVSQKSKSNPVFTIEDKKINTQAIQSPVAAAQSSWLSKRLPHQAIPELIDAINKLIASYNPDTYSITDCKAPTSHIQQTMQVFIFALPHHSSDLAQYNSILKSLSANLEQHSDPFSSSLTLQEKAKLLASFEKIFWPLMEQFKLLGNSLSHRRQDIKVTLN